MAICIIFVKYSSDYIFPLRKAFQWSHFTCGTKYGIKTTIWSLLIFSLTLLKLNSLFIVSVYLYVLSLFFGMLFPRHPVIWLSGPPVHEFSFPKSPLFSSSSKMITSIIIDLEYFDRRNELPSSLLPHHLVKPSAWHIIGSQYMLSGSSHSSGLNFSERISRSPLSKVAHTPYSHSCSLYHVLLLCFKLSEIISSYYLLLSVSSHQKVVRVLTLPVLPSCP